MTASSGTLKSIKTNIVNQSFGKRVLMKALSCEALGDLSGYNGNISVICGNRTPLYEGYRKPMSEYACQYLPEQLINAAREVL